MAGFYIGFESWRSRQRSEKAIQTLEDAKRYVTTRTEEFDKTIRKKIEEISTKYKNLFQMSLEQLSQDTDEAARKIKDIKEKGITTEAEKKIESLEKRIRLFEEIGVPDDPKLLYSKAMICKEKNMKKESLELLQKAVQLDTKYVNAYFWIGYIKGEMDDFNGAVEAYDKVIDLNPKNSGAFNNKGVALSKLDRCQEAVEYYNKAIQLDPKDLLYYENKIEALLKLKNIGEGLDTINKMIEIDSSNNTYYKIGRLLSKNDYFDEALKYYQNVSEKQELIINKSDAREQDLTEYLEILLILNKLEKAAKFIEERKDLIKSINYKYLLNFLLICLNYLSKKCKIGFEYANEIVKIDIEETLKIGWIFDDIDPFLKLRLNENQYKVCSIIEGFLKRKIKSEEAKKEINKLKD